MLGKINKDELKEASHNNPSSYVTIRSFSSKNPLYAFHTKVVGLALVGGVGFTGVAMMQGYNLVWLFASVVPLYTALAYNHVNQPKQHLLNLMDYILEVRQASYQAERYKKEFEAIPFTNKKEFKDLKNYMQSTQTTLYQLESKLADDIASGKFK